MHDKMKVAFKVILAMITGLVFYVKKLLRKSKNKELIIFSRYPCPGTTKTRLIPDIGAENAAFAQLKMTEHILENVGKFYDSDNDISTIMYYNGGSEKQMRYWLDRRKQDISWQEQGKGGLGDKLSAAFVESFQRGSKQTVVIGSDIPGISSSILQEAYSKLHDGRDMVIGPAADGGYYLIGLSKEAVIDIDKLFSNINWGTDTVFKEQLARAEAQGLSCEVLETVLNDVDLIEDIPVIERELKITRQQLTNPSISIIIPVYNEAKSIVSTLKNAIQNCGQQTALAEIIVSDGGSSDDTVAVVKKFASRSEVKIKINNSSPGRGFQLRNGALSATGDIYIFLHADTTLPKNYDEEIRKCLRVPGNVAGCFKFGLDVLEDPERSKEITSAFKVKMRLLTKATNFRASTFELPYGDQAIFMPKETYKNVGGFKEIYLMEDYIMVEALRNIGHVAVANCDPVITSARRWEKYGILKATGLNQLIVIAYKLGVHPNTLAQWYYSDKLKTLLQRQKRD